MEKRIVARLRELEAPPRSLLSWGKFGVYEFARSHGVDVPAQLGLWETPADIPWDELPAHVVIKSSFGSTSRGVLPLHRVDDGWQIATHVQTLSNEDLAATLGELGEQTLIRGPFAAEEFLTEDEDHRPPTDVKMYGFYGEVPLLLLRQSDRHGDRSASRFRVVDAQGKDLFDTYHGRPTDRGIEVPATLDELLDAASRLSIAFREPFVRVDLYSVRDRVVFGEFTPRPGGRQWFGAALDRRLGEEWEKAEARFGKDLAFGASRLPQMGPVAIDAPLPPVSAFDPAATAETDVSIADLEEQLANLRRHQVRSRRGGAPTQTD